jgi:hypothetical protein
MPQALPTTAAAIHDRLLADTALAAALGVYTFTGGTTRPAMAVLARNEQLPPGTTVDGVEVVITAIPSGAERALMTGGTLTNPTWRLYVSGWQTAAALETVRARIIALLPGATSSTIDGDAPGEGIGVVDQIVVRWTNPTVVVS